MIFPLVSIIIPVYNREKYLQDTLASCLEQTYQNIEIIVIDDGSVDSTWQVLSEIKKEYPEKIKSFRNVSNQGQCFARNIGLQASSGKYLKYLDSDDILLSSSIERQVKLLLYTQSDLVACKSQIFWDNELSNIKLSVLENLQQVRENYQPYESLLDLIKTHDITFNEVLISKNLFNGLNGFCEHLRAAEEINLLLKLATLHPVCKSIVSDEILLLKRVGYYSLAYKMRSQKDIPWLLLSLKDAANFYLANQSLNPDHNSSLKTYISNRLYWSCIYAYRNGLKENSWDAMHIWKKFFVLPPEITPFYHNWLHKILGFEVAESFLEKVRLVLKHLRFKLISESD